MIELPHWPRDLYQSTEQRAFLFYIVFGDCGPGLSLDATKHRSAGLPEECQLTLLERSKHGDYMSGICEGYLWEEMVAGRPHLARKVEAASTCVVLKGEFPDPPTLNYFRDCIGLLAGLLDQGGYALYDPFQLRWWSPEEWRRDVIEPIGPHIGRHVVVLTSEEGQPGLTWVHTRGMRKFARPEISVHDVGQERLPAVIDLCRRLIELQRRGGVIPEGEEVRMRSLPAGGISRHRGDLDDPDFNNVHVEIVWPEGALAR